jgi:hypothetical protein
MGRIAYHTFAIQLADYQTVLNLDRELLSWRESLPPFLAMKHPDTSLDNAHPYLFVQRHLLACEWYYTRITLNRCDPRLDQLIIGHIYCVGNLRMRGIRIPRTQPLRVLRRIC